MLKTFLSRLGLILFFCLAAAGTLPGEEQSFEAAIGADGTQHVDIVAGSYYFNPNHIIVEVNIPVQLTIRKEGGVIPHDIVLNAPEAGIDFKEELTREAKTITFTPTKPGNYTFYCDKKPPFGGKSHREKGMVGVLEVVE
jgi:plastocyanin domain-containing protein